MYLLNLYISFTFIQ